MSKLHIVSIDNEFGHISNVTLYSSHDTEKEATDALEVINNASRQSYVDRDDREKENYKRYLKWGSKATIECPNEHSSGLNWVKYPGDERHSDHIENIPFHVVRQCDGKTTISSDLIEIKSSEPLSLLDELAIPPEHCLEYHLVEPK